MTLRTPAFNDAKTYGAEWLRYNTEIDNQEGALNGGDLKVTAAAGGGMRVDIAAGAALVKGDSGAPGTGLSQGLFIVVNDASVANAVTLSAAHATLPRLDSIIMRVRDSSDLGSGADDAIFDFLTGVATSGATLDNRTGAAALPNDAMLLADVLVPAASVAVTAGNVRDRRRWARGAMAQIAGVWTFSSASSTYIDVSTTINGDAPTIPVELSGAPVFLEASGVVSTQAGAGTGGVRLVTATAPPGATDFLGLNFGQESAQSTDLVSLRYFAPAPTPGRWLFKIQGHADGVRQRNFGTNTAGGIDFGRVIVREGGISYTGPNS